MTAPATAAAQPRRNPQRRHSTRSTTAMRRQRPASVSSSVTTSALPGGSVSPRMSPAASSHDLVSHGSLSPSSSSRTLGHSRNTSAVSGAWWHMALSEGVWICALIFGGCCSNVIALEMIFRQVPKSASLLTFMQFMFVSVEGMIWGGFVQFERVYTVHPSLRGYIPKEVVSKRASSLPFRLHLKPCVIPMRHWLLMVAMFWTLSMMNNWALDYQIDMPLHILFKSGGLLLNMLMGYAIMNKRYSWSQLVSVTMITCGVVVATYTSASSVRHQNGSQHIQPPQELHWHHWIVGILLLSTSLLISSLLGLYQEHTYRRYGKQWREGLFYTHFLGLPIFLFLWRDIVQQAYSVAASPHVSVGDALTLLMAGSDAGLHFVKQLIPAFLLAVSVPKLLLVMVANAMTQYLCISGVHQLTTVATSLTVNLVLTARKFVSLLISIYFFPDANFSAGHWLGTAFVFVGTVIYSAASTRRPPPPVRVRNPSTSRLQ